MAAAAAPLLAVVTTGLLTLFAHFCLEPSCTYSLLPSGFAVKNPGDDLWEGRRAGGPVLPHADA